MPYKEILVHVRSTGSIEPVEVAIRLAKRFEARVTALYALRDVAIYRSLLRSDSMAVEDFIRREYGQAEKVEERFRELAEQESVTFDWQVGEGDPADLMAYAARLNDLVIVGKTEPGDAGWGVAERMVSTMSRPTLVVPSTGPFLRIGENVLIAWNDSAQSAAAVVGAGPFLTAAKHVTVLVGEGRERFPTVTRRPQVDLQAYLERRGVEAEYRPIGAPDTDAGNAILDVANDTGSDLIVMGAYGRSRLREFVLGGATQLVLEHTSVPVLMAH